MWKKKVFYSLWVLKGTTTNKEAFAFAGVNVFVCAYVSACASLSNYTSSVLSSLLNYILFVPLGAEGPVNCLEARCSFPLFGDKASFNTANPNIAFFFSFFFLLHG